MHLQGALSLFGVGLTIVGCGLTSLAARQTHIASMKCTAIAFASPLVVKGLAELLAPLQHTHSLPSIRLDLTGGAWREVDWVVPVAAAALWP